MRALECLYACGEKRKRNKICIEIMLNCINTRVAQPGRRGTLNTRVAQPGRRGILNTKVAQPGRRGRLNTRVAQPGKEENTEY